MNLSRTGLVYILTMIVSGFLIAAILVARPSWQDAFLPPVAWPFAVSFVFELVLNVGGRGRFEPLAMGERLAGILPSCLIVIARHVI
ncbi:hypothetical protein [Microvirga flavescens]|uniref:hypothetical protein n=1 Tax=Microvirga flavescens TaxID=2249811 RepID=UPI000DD6940F|nr:hypothetical protein [Microvirga flavescens]